MVTSNNQTVLTMTDYYEKPYHGVANLFGHPHIYEVHQTSEDVECYYLKPIYDPVLLDLLLEDWDIWVRYYNSTILGTENTEDQDLCLGEDRERFHQVNELLKKYSCCVSVDELSRVIRADGEFTPKQRGVAKPDTVNWSNIEYGADYSVVNFLMDVRGVIRRDKLNDVDFVFTECDEE